MVKCDDYVEIKKKLREKYGEPMTFEDIEQERLNFQYMDTFNSGSITWTQFLSFEAPSLIAKMNKVELANRLSLNELITAKKHFKKHDKNKIGVIPLIEAKSVYVFYVEKLRY